MRTHFARRPAALAWLIVRPLTTAILLAEAPRPASADPLEWKRWPMPSPRSNFAQAYDPDRNWIVISGGLGAGPEGNTGETWILDLSGSGQWHYCGGLEGSHDEVTIYDPPGDRIVRFGGINGDFLFFNTTSVFSLATRSWSFPTITGTPPPGFPFNNDPYRVGAFDSLRRRLIVLGFGFDAYALDLASLSWSHLPPDPNVGGENPIAATYDSARDRLVVDGGGELWEMPLAGPLLWSRMTPDGVPNPAIRPVYEPARDRFDFPYPDGLWTLNPTGPPTFTKIDASPTGPFQGGLLDPVNDRFVTLGWTDRSEAWGYGLATNGWSQLYAGSPTPQKIGHTAVVAPPLDAMLVFGSPGTETWRFALDGSGFSVLPAAGTPPIRKSHAATYDPLRHRMLVFGGNSGPDHNDVHELTVTGTPTWSPVQISGTPPSPRANASAVYDPVRDRLIVVGGGTTLTDVWALSLSGTPTWSQLVPNGTISNFFGLGAAVYDSRRDRVILLGTQFGAEGDRTKAWALPLDGPPAWSVLAGGASTAERHEFAAVYDSTNDRVLAYGGYERSPDFRYSTLLTLSLGLTETWATPTPMGTFQPPARLEFTLAHDPRRARWVMFGGMEAMFGFFTIFNSRSAWFLTDHGVPLDVPPSAPPGVSLELVSCRLIAPDLLSVRYSTASEGALSIEVLDIQGRRLGQGEVTAMTAGQGDATVTLARAAPPGFAIVRVRQGAREAVRKFVTIR